MVSILNMFFPPNRQDYLVALKEILRQRKQKVKKNTHYDIDLGQKQKKHLTVGSYNLVIEDKEICPTQRATMDSIKRRLFALLRRGKQPSPTFDIVTVTLF